MTSWTPDAVARQRMRGLQLWQSTADDPASAVSQLVAMQAQEHPYARWSLAQRAKSASTAGDVDKAFDEGRILRTHVLRPTWHYVAPTTLSWLIKLSGPRVGASNARRYEELGLDTRTRGKAAEVIATEVAAGPKTRAELGQSLERRGISVAAQRLPHILMHAELTAAICSGPIRDSQHTYAPFDERVPRSSGPEGDAALAELAHRYFTTRGPATVDDFAWWCGFGVRDARAAVEAAARRGLEPLTVDGRTYWFVPDTRRAPSSPQLDLVQCYDEAIISYRQSRDVLQTSDVNFAVPRAINGFVHVVLRNGQLAGHWRVVRGRREIRVETRMVSRLTAKEQVMLDEAVARYQRFAGL